MFILEIFNRNTCKLKKITWKCTWIYWNFKLHFEWPPWCINCTQTNIRDICCWQVLSSCVFFVAILCYFKKDESTSFPIRLSRRYFHFHSLSSLHIGLFIIEYRNFYTGLTLFLWALIKVVSRNGVLATFNLEIQLLVFIICFQ